MFSAQTCEWLLLLLCPPGEPPQPAGVLLLDSVSDKLDIKLKPTIDIEDEVVLEVWAEIEDDLMRKAEEGGRLGHRLVGKNGLSHHPGLFA
jgi:hypothetical protein